MIQDTRTNSKSKLKLKPSERLRTYFVSLARQLLAWQAQADDRMSVGVSSVDAGVGKSTVAFNLAAALAGLGPGKILLVETDFGHSYIGRRIAAPANGLGEIVSGQVAPQDCIHPTTVERLYVIGCGRINARQGLELPYGAISKLNQDMSEDFSMIVYDLPVAATTTHCLPIAHQLDGSLIACDAEDVHQEKIEQIRRRMDQFGSQIIGLILNKAKQS